MVMTSLADKRWSLNFDSSSGIPDLVLFFCLKARLQATALTVGDIVFVNSGDASPADLRVLQCSNLKLDKSSLTGESEPVSVQPELKEGQKKENVSNLPSTEVSDSYEYVQANNSKYLS